MVFINYNTQQMAAKVVYYGPGLCGKTTNLQWIFDHSSPDSRGEMVSLATESDRTLFFDLLPIEVGTIGGFNTRIQLYTVPGQVFYNSTRKLVLRGVDGVVFVADSQRDMLQANIDSLDNLAENLAEMEASIETIPLVLQLNKRDLPDLLPVDQLNGALNRHGWPVLEAEAIHGTGVIETLKTISKATLHHLRRQMTKDKSGRLMASGSRPVVVGQAPAPQPAVPAPPRPAPPPPAAPRPAAPPPAVSAPPRPAAPAPAAAPAPKRWISCQLEALTYERLAVGRHSLLRVSVSTEDLDAVSGELSLDVLVSAKDFESAGSDHQTFTISAGEAPDPLLFKLIPRSPGKKDVKVHLFQDARYVGSLTITTEAVVAEGDVASSPVAVEGSVTLDREAKAPDLTLVVTEHPANEHSRSYRFTLHSPRHGLFYYTLREELRFYGSPPAWTDGLYREIVSLRPEEVTETLSAIGFDLYEKLFPRELKKVWGARVRGKVETLMIVSEENWIPWEMIKPHHEDEEGSSVEDDFLCGDYVLGRWVAGSSPPAAAEVKKSALAAPRGPLRCSFKVHPELGKRFVTTFCRAVQEGRTLGESVRTARAELRGYPQAAWLAYSLLADPLARGTLKD